MLNENKPTYNIHKKIIFKYDDGFDVYNGNNVHNYDDFNANASHDAYDHFLGSPQQDVCGPFSKVI